MSQENVEVVRRNTGARPLSRKRQGGGVGRPRTFLYRGGDGR